MSRLSSDPEPTRRVLPIVLALVLVLSVALVGAAPSPAYAAAASPGVTTDAQANAAPVRTARWILIDLSQQRLYAYQGTKVVYSWRISSGVLKYPSVVGTFRVYAKLPKQRMTGGRGADHYDLPNVPNVMYFYAGYAIHGAYWHNNFGRPMSHGCINMPLAAAAWLYKWTPMGTTVVVQR